MAAKEHKAHKEISDAELWKTIPFDEQVEIDMAIDQGKKIEAVKRCVCSGKGFTFEPAKSFVDRRSVELTKRHIPRKS